MKRRIAVFLMIMALLMLDSPLALAQETWETGEDPADEDSPYCGDWYAEDGSIYLELGESAALMNSKSDRRTGTFWLESEGEFLYGEYMENKDGSLKLICWDIPGTMEKDLVYRVEIQKDNTGETILVLEGTPLYRE